jgi:lipopolysaccharide transport system ATP-binding protein
MSTDAASPTSNKDALVRVEGVRKKFCRSLKRSLWYGVKDVASELNPFGGNGHRSETSLRKDEFWAVNDVTFELQRGECLGLIGHNGAGKTTLLKMLNGLIKPDRGRIEMRGRVAALIALGAGFNPILSGRENIYVNGSVLGLSKREIDSQIDEIIDFAEIREFIDMPVQSYSSGMAVRLGFAVAIKCQPDVLLLDEVLAVGDVGFQAKCFNALSEFKRNGTAFILVSHNMHQISRYCDQVLYLSHGNIVELGDVDTAITRFLREMDPSDSSIESEHTDWSKVYGSGKVVLKSAIFLNAAGEKIEEISPGDSFSLAIDYECLGERVENPIIDLVIRDRDGVLFQGTSDGLGVFLGKLERRGQIVITVEEMPVSRCNLQFSFLLFDKATGEVYDWRRNVLLRVARHVGLTGKLFLRTKWELRSTKSHF